MESTGSVLGNNWNKSHICCFVENDRERRAVLDLVQRHAREHNKRVLYLGQPLSKADGSFDPDAAFSLLERQCEQPLSEGLNGLLAIMDLTGALEKPVNQEDVEAYESQANAFISSHGGQCRLICLYQQQSLGSLMAMRILTHHSQIAVGTEVLDNILPASISPAISPDDAAEVWLKALFEQKRIETGLRRSNRALKALNECIRAKPGEASEADLMRFVCRTVVREGQYRMAWAGYVAPGANRSINRAGCAILDEPILQESESHFQRLHDMGEDAAWEAIRTARPFVSQPALEGKEIGTAPEAEASVCPRVSSVAIPLADNGQIFGVLAIQAHEAERFEKDEIDSLIQIADHLSVRVSALRTQAESRYAEAHPVPDPSEHEFRMLFEAMNEGLGVQNANNIISYANTKFCEIVGYPRSELLGRPITDMLDELQQSAFEGEMALRQQGQKTSSEVNMVTRDGARVPAILSGSPIFDEYGTFRGSIVAITDISVLKEAEERIRESEAKYRTIFEKSPLGIVHFDRNGIITACNDNVAEIVGSSKEHMVGFNLKASLRDESMRSAVLSCLSENIAHYEGYYQSIFSGKVTPLKAIFGPVLSEDGSVLGGIGIVEDISERRKAEEAIQESTRQLRMLSARLLSTQEDERKRIAGELHDSIGSSLSAIRFSLDSILASHGQVSSSLAEAVRNLISLTQSAIDESRRIMTDLRPSILDDLGILPTLHWLCKRFESVYSSIHMEKKIEVEEENVPEPLKIVIFRIIQEALHNIVKYSKANRVHLSLEKGEGTIELAIRDTGIGFDVSALSPRRNGDGGLGLTSMRERTELCGGRFEVHSEPGKGTIIHAAWPLEGRKDE